MKKFLNEFKEFAMRGNVVDMAVGVIIGAAFGKVVTAVIDIFLTPILEALPKLENGGTGFVGSLISFCAVLVEFILTALVLLGDIPGVFLLKSANAQAIKVLLGGVIILLGLSMLRPQTAVRKRPSWPVIALVSVISGLLCGLYGIGALVAVLCAHITDNSHASKGTMNVILLGDNLFRVIVYAATGILTGPVIKQALLLMPVMVAGLLLGIRCIAKVNERTARFIIILALILSGAALIITNL